jgi:hypothetical protein
MFGSSQAPVAKRNGRGGGPLGWRRPATGGHQQEECVQFTNKGKAALIGVALATMSPAAAKAAEPEMTTRTTTTQQNQGQREENDVPWGLAGLLGLLGLLGLRKKESDIHVDARHRDDTTRRP